MRLDEAREKGVPWKQWGHTSANAYHWGEDGLGLDQRRPPGAVFCGIQRRSVLRRVGGVRESCAFDLSEYDIDGPPPVPMSKRATRPAKIPIGARASIG
jgi:hypothetical protein